MTSPVKDNAIKFIRGKKLENLLILCRKRQFFHTDIFHAIVFVSHFLSSPSPWTFSKKRGHQWSKKPFFFSYGVSFVVANLK